jgi:hypothetical protein
MEWVSSARGGLRPIRGRNLAGFSSSCIRNSPIPMVIPGLKTHMSYSRFRNPSFSESISTFAQRVTRGFILPSAFAPGTDLTRHPKQQVPVLSCSKLRSCLGTMAKPVRALSVMSAIVGVPNRSSDPIDGFTFEAYSNDHQSALAPSPHPARALSAVGCDSAGEDGRRRGERVAREGSCARR